jgi:hypothetical protein
LMDVEKSSEKDLIAVMEAKGLILKWLIFIINY